MYLQSLKYSEWQGNAQEWTLEGLSLGSRNLIVGKNASGKSRTLNVINALSKHLAGNQPAPLSGNFDAAFSQDGKALRYELRYEEEKVLTERFSIDGTVLLNRGEGGEGVIWAEEIDGGKDVRFQTPPSELAAVARRDAIQHKYLEALHAWGASVRLYHFGTPLGKDHFAIILEKPGAKLNENDQNAVVGLYRKAEKEFGEPFREAIIRDLESVGYPTEQIGVAPLVSLRVVSNVPGELVGLYVKERGLRGITDQHSMSQGMFRALSLFIHINYCQFSKTATCILIDDIGEGLDFDRSCHLIDTLRSKTENAGIQLVLTTNDRFVMNRVPLEEWSVLQRTGSIVRVKNYENSRKMFEEFKFTGLSNFSFLELDVVNDPRAGARAPDA